MRAGQRPASAAVIEFSVGPEQRVMAGGALCRREAGCNVIGNGTAERRGAVPIGLVASDAGSVGRSQRVVAAQVALRAGRNFSGWSELM